MQSLLVGMPLFTVTKRLKVCIPISVWIQVKVVKFIFSWEPASLIKLRTCQNNQLPMLLMVVRLMDLWTGDTN